MNVLKSFFLAACLLVCALPMNGFDIVVAQDGSGHFTTVQEAINAVPDFRKSGRTTILIRRGVYHERVTVPQSKTGIRITAEEGAVIEDGGYALKANRFGEGMGTSGSATVYVFANDFYAEGLTMSNTAGAVGQAVACFISGDRVQFRHCRFLGYQDTLYNWGKDSRQYFEDCYIEGTIDFIFGWSQAVFNRCTIHSKAPGFITAPSTDQGKPYGYTFINCRLTADEGVDSVYLGRPWRPYGQSVYINCYMGAHILPEGWNNWDNAANEHTCYFAEQGSHGPGANATRRAAWAHQLADIERYNLNTILCGDDGWNPATEGDLLLNIKR